MTKKKGVWAGRWKCWEARTQHTSWQSTGKQRDERREEVGVCGGGRREEGRRGGEEVRGEECTL